MKTVGITGGIGSGKSTVCEIFKTLGIGVFHADNAAKRVYELFPSVKEEIRQRFGESVFDGPVLSKQKLADLIFRNKSARKFIEHLVHPKVKEMFDEWQRSQASSYLIREAAILIESGAWKDCSQIIVVTAPEALCIERTARRSGLSEDEVKSRIKTQMSEKERLDYADFVITNDEKQLLVPQVLRVHELLLEASGVKT